MSIAEQIEQALKDAMRAKDKAVVSCLRQIKAKAQEAENAPGFAGPKDDSFWQGVIGRYAKMLTKSLEELKGGGERGEALTTSYQAELSYLARFLPKPLSDSDLGTAVQKLLAGGSFELKDAGRLLGQLLGAHRGQLEPGRARQALEAGLKALMGPKEPS